MTDPTSRTAAPTPAAADTADTAEQPIRLCRPPLWSQGLNSLVTLALMSGVLCLLETHRMGTAGRGSGWLRIGLSLFVTAAMGVPLQLAWRLWRRRRPAPPLTLGPVAVALPPHPESLARRPVPYSTLVSVLETSQQRQRILFIEAERAVYALPASLFAEADGIDRLAAELKRRIWAAPGGRERVEATRQRREAARHRLQDDPFFSRALIGLMVVMFAGAWCKGSLESRYDLMRWGAMVPAWVRAGELWRLVAASFLHTSFLHALISLSTLFTVASQLERLLGWPRLVLLVTAGSGVVMGVAATDSSLVAVVGSSGCLSVLLGSFAVVGRRLRLVLPLGVLQPARWWAFVLCLQVVFNARFWPLSALQVLPVGFAFGALVTTVMLGRRARLPSREGGRWRQVGALGAAVVLVSLGLAIAHASQSDEDEDLRLAQSVALAEGPGLQPLREALALGWAGQETVSVGRLACAHALAARNRREAPLDPRFAQTLSLVLARQRQLPEALVHGLAALELARAAPPYLLTLGRLLDQAYREGAIPDPAAAGALPAVATFDPHSSQIALTQLPSEEPTHVFLLLRLAGQSLWLVHAETSAHSPLPQVYRHPHGWLQNLLAKADLVVAWTHPAAASPPAVPAGQPARWHDIGLFIQRPPR